MPPPPNTPLGPNPALNLNRGYQTGSSPTADDASDPTSSRRTGEMRQEGDRRERAAMVLGSWEQLSWHSHTYGESIPQTRLRLEKIMNGLEAGSGEEEWEDEGEGDEKGKEREREKVEKQKRIRRTEGNARKRTAENG
ncbi:hypothetical protein HO133_002278 [Letharia lupina]|uniref:Uncharacterized protein n=1 Tax=Letharia lupina TaxID=560253 RepID=A0A8H6CDK4_9LECA|nr:uncharacterized protein HO133_002278 [Letharia lupina]KAF6221423.1 hypothetical protein HO133_002278 [Letharia lupina]